MSNLTDKERIEVVTEKISEAKSAVQNLPSPTDYTTLTNKPSINSVELNGNKTLSQLGVQPEGDYPEERITNSDIEELLNNFVG